MWIKYAISAAAVIAHEKVYSRKSDGIVLNQAKTVHSHIILNTHEPIITMNDGIPVLPSPLEAAIVQSIKAEMQYESDIIESRCIPASITAASVEKSDKNCRPMQKIPTPMTSAIVKEYARLMKYDLSTRFLFPAPKFWPIKVAQAV